MCALDNPRGMAFGADGALFVAEAGHGGAPCGVVPPGGVALSCYGLTGAISRLWHGQQDRIVSKLPSVSFRFGAQARGPNDGKLIRVACGGHPLACDGLHPTTVLDGLDGPTSLAFGPDGALYVTNKGALPAFSPTSAYKPQGEVLRIDLPHDADRRR
jgi:hypothetical protein